MNKVDKHKLYSMYIDKQMPMHKIASEMGIAIGTVYNYLKKYDIETRNQKNTFTMLGRKLDDNQKARISKLHKGKVLSEETKKKISESSKRGGIGHKKNRSDGYIGIYFPDHPNSNNDGYIMEHILVMEALVGRHLEADECVHHINLKRDDNRKENLKLMTTSEHMSYHMRKRWKNKKGGMTYQ